MLDRPASEKPAARRLIHWRRLWRTLHLWLGLSAGLFLAVAGLSGSVLVFNETLVRAEAGDVLFPKIADRPWRPVSEWIEKAEARYPDMAPIESVHGAGALPLACGVPTLFKHMTRADGSEGHAVIGVDPVTGEPTGIVVAEDIWAGFFLLLHVELLAGETGHLLVALSALGGLILTASGLYLWWPRPGRWRQTLALRAGAFGRARWLDYHNVPTVWLFVPYLVVLVTGLYLQRSDWIDPLVEPLSEIRELDNSASASSPPGACAAATGIDEAIALARTGRDPAEVIKAIWRPSGPQTPYFIELNAPGRNPRAGASVIWVDRNCPRVISVRDLSTLTTAETVKSWLWPVHTDLGLGLVGQGLVFLTGLLMTALFATGAVLWWQRR